MQERVEKEKHYIILKVLYKEDYVNTSRRIDVPTKEEMEKISCLDLSSTLREPTIKEEKKEISKNIIIIKQSTKRKVASKKRNY